MIMLKHVNTETVANADKTVILHIDASHTELEEQ